MQEIIVFVHISANNIRALLITSMSVLLYQYNIQKYQTALFHTCDVVYDINILTTHHKNPVHKTKRIHDILPKTAKMEVMVKFLRFHFNFSELLKLCFMSLEILWHDPKCYTCPFHAFYEVKIKIMYRTKSSNQFFLTYLHCPLCHNYS